MGWSSSRAWDSKKSLVEHLVHNFKPEIHSTVGKVWYALCPYTDKDGAAQKVIVVCLLDNFAKRGEDPEWAYKDMSESCYPYRFSCPEKILAGSTYQDERAVNWREACRAFRANKFTPKDGMKIRFTRENLPEWCKGERDFRVDHRHQWGKKRGYFTYTAIADLTICYRLPGTLLSSLKPIQI